MSLSFKPLASCTYKVPCLGYFFDGETETSLVAVLSQDEENFYIRKVREGELLDDMISVPREVDDPSNEPVVFYVPKKNLVKEYNGQLKEYLKYAVPAKRMLLLQDHQKDKVDVLTAITRHTKGLLDTAETQLDNVTENTENLCAMAGRTQNLFGLFFLEMTNRGIQKRPPPPAGIRSVVDKAGNADQTIVAKRSQTGYHPDLIRWLYMAKHKRAELEKEIGASIRGVGGLNRIAVVFDLHDPMAIRMKDVHFLQELVGFANKMQLAKSKSYMQRIIYEANQIETKASEDPSSAEATGRALPKLKSFLVDWNVEDHEEAVKSGFKNYSDDDHATLAVRIIDLFFHVPEGFVFESKKDKPIKSNPRGAMW